MRKILIATTNTGKFQEIASELADLKFEFVSLADVGLASVELNEPFSTTWENALYKAKFFAKRSKLLTIAEDAGIFIQALDGKPGVLSKRFAATAEERNLKVLELMKNIPEKKRQAYFEDHVCVYNPQTDQFSLFRGTAEGYITKTLGKTARKGVGYDSIFYYPPAKKLFAEMSLLEKNLVSHRGKAVIQTKVFLQKQYGFRQIVVPVGLVVHKRKILMNKRRDARAEMNNKWEFPGGGVENGEDVEASLLRECKEETGLDLKIEERLPHIISYSAAEKKGGFQIFLIPFICTVKSGTLHTADNEVAGSGWFTYDEAIKQDLLLLNKKLIQVHKAIIKKYID